MRVAFAPSLALAKRSARLALRCSTAPPSTCRAAPLRVVCTATSPARNPLRDVPVGAQLSSNQIREAFLAFYEHKAHQRLPSASLVPDDPTIMLTIAGMVPFKPVFMGMAPRQFPRATTSQKCIRTNDIHNVGVTKRHHTFFEMLGNFSFADYFKPHAIQWAWQLLTQVYQIPPQRLAVSVFETDDEAFTIWRDHVGVPAHRIQRMSAQHNFWASGPTGPCGPCSEIYFDFDPLSEQPIHLEDDHRFIELYNLVFMQYQRDAHGNLTPLAAKNIDTGMGLERVAQVLQRVDNNYETDLIKPIIDAVARVANLSYLHATHAQKTSFKVVGDHLRAVSHLVADGVRPSNVGRGYIVRRLLRRVVRHGRLLGIQHAFVAQIVPTVSELAKEAGLTSIHDKIDLVVTELSREEQRFLQTLERGEDRLDQVLHNLRESGTRVIAGEDAFELYDTFGFPLELTEEIAAENDFKIDVERFDRCMAEQRRRARAARDAAEFDVHAVAVLSEAVSKAGSTTFEGYHATLLEESPVSALLSITEKATELRDRVEEGHQVRVLLSRSPFYAEGGGQVGDTGLLQGPNGVIRVDDTQKEAGTFVHIGQVAQGYVNVGDKVRAVVDASARRKIMAHHTATHLLQAALKHVIADDGISQAGSLVDADRLRFDFNCPRAVSQDELQAVEDVINKWIGEAHETEVSFMSLDEAKAAGAVAMFGEKYDASEVRVVDVPGVSMELCGGTHVRNTVDIGLFKIVSESGPSSGVRRIEAVCGAAVMPYLSVRDAAVKKLSTSLKAKPEELPSRVSALQEELKAKSKQLDQALADLAVAKAMGLAADAKGVGEFKHVIERLDGLSSDSLKAAAENLSEHLGEKAITLLASENNGKVSFACAVGKAAQKKGVTAGKLVGSVAKLCGGGGGGRPHFAQAGGKDPTKLGEALRHAVTVVEEAFSE
ncbi:Alanine--tRNA ligase [Gracilariopsis chorda]|uniref:Alanine--tRNA ligase n=1 Tax=Gracilariopsis chorda TaxID=448386 RepID=A0A2V3J020_9FLOR|nr:Alanine--tRNA ligase [Gracilariopsis chorda]|eukprot:PXF47744.1 Alanine--tRNA ligase [Gracilariopsis chorda]